MNREELAEQLETQSMKLTASMKCIDKLMDLVLKYKDSCANFAYELRNEISKCMCEWEEIDGIEATPELDHTDVTQND